MLTSTHRLILTTTCLLTLTAFVGCRTHKFSGGGHTKKAPPLCSEVKAIDGINVAFMIDNSSSNNITDCPDRTYVGKNAKDPSVSEYECKSATNREKAVLATYDFINSFEPKDKNSISQLGISSFPTADDMFDGFELRSKEWLQVDKDSRVAAEGDMAFSRKPLGSTPYHAAMEGGLELYKKMDDHGKPKLAFLVTDGEPTDSDASLAKKAADKLRKMGVKIVTVFIAGADTREQRRARHLQYLKEIGQDEANIDELMGLNGKQSLVDTISDQKIEVADSSQLESVFRDVIKNTVNCREE